MASISIKRMMGEYGIGGILVAIIVLYLLYMVYQYMMQKGMMGKMGMSSLESGGTSQGNGAGSGTGTTSPAGMYDEPGVRPSEPLGRNEVYSSVSAGSPTGQGLPSACNKPSPMNPAELLPKDVNKEWSQLNPSGKGQLENINLLKAGWLIGIDTIGQTLRNANLQIRSEPPNPQIYVGPWNLSTIQPDFMRPPLELGQGYQ